MPIEKHKGVVVECRVNNFTAGVSGEGKVSEAVARRLWRSGMRFRGLDARRSEWVICERGLPPPPFNKLWSIMTGTVEPRQHDEPV